MREQILPDGSRDYGQGVIGPSAQDIVFSNNPNRPPLDRFPTRQALATTAIITAPFAVSGCVSITPASTEGNQNLADTQTSDPNGEASIGDRFDAFLAQNEGKILSSDLNKMWVESLGIPPEILDTIREDDNYPHYIFNVRSDQIELKNYFKIIPKETDNIPQKGDIILGELHDYNPSGKITIAAGEGETGTDGFRYVKVITQGDTLITDYTKPISVEKYDLSDTLGWLRPKVNSDTNINTGGQGDQGGDVLVARVESIADHFQSFKDNYNGQFVEKNDPSNLNQCMDLVVAWADELGIPRDAVTGILYAKNLYLTPKQRTKDYFDIIPNENGSIPQTGDVVIWNEAIGGNAGHAAIASGDVFDGGFKVMEQNYPTGSQSQVGFHGLNDSVLGWLRPKGFDSNPEPTKAPEQAIEYDPNNPEEFAKYQIANMLFGTFDETRYGNGYWMKWTNLSDSDKERVKREFATGIKTDPIDLYEIAFPSNVRLTDLPSPQLYVHDNNGDIYEWDARVTHGIYKNATISLEADSNVSETRNAEYLTWSGTVTFNGEFKYGVADIIARGSADNLDQALTNGFNKITKLSPWIPITSRIFKVYVYASGDVEIDGWNTTFNDPEGSSGQQEFGIEDNFGLSINNTVSGDDGGYNGQFILNP